MQGENSAKVAPMPTSGNMINTGGPMASTHGGKSNAASALASAFGGGAGA